MGSIPHVFSNGVEFKKCADCKVLRRLERFQKCSSNKDGLNAYCKACRSERARKAYKEKNGIDAMRSHHLRRTYGITAEEYNAMLLKQNSVCAICGKPETKIRKGNTVFRLAVDHCHNTGKVRSLLCQSCNLGIGGLHHNTTLLKKAIQYLKNTSENNGD